MIKNYNFDYNTGEAEAFFKVDTDKFMAKDAKLLLEFFDWDWDYDKDEDPVDELMKKYALQAIRIASSEDWNERGVKKWFSEQEGYIAVDGSQGVELMSVTGYEFDESYFDVEIVSEP